MLPYYADEWVTLYHGDCRDIPEWLDADFLCTDPPFGRSWKQGNLKDARRKPDSHDGIRNDKTTHMRDWALGMWGSEKRAAVFGDLMLAPPDGTKQVLIYEKPSDGGRRAATGGFRRDVEAIYLMGGWNYTLAGRTSILRTRVAMLSGASGYAASCGHPHAKPLDVMMELIEAVQGCTLVADPFAGSGSTLLAARRLGLKAVGVEVDERYASRAATRLSEPEMIY
jgi:site-specific DNA-methyltransferase (adenine-specific)